MPTKREAQTRAQARKRLATPNGNLSREYIKAVESGQALFGDRELKALQRAKARSGRVASNVRRGRSAATKPAPKGSARKGR
jgi:hypothetical protein